MSKKEVAAKVNSAFGRNMAAYSGGQVLHEKKDQSKKTVTDKLFKASRLDVMKEARSNNAKADKHTLR
jgi:hypothetical protein